MDLGTVLTAVDTVRKALEIYQRVEELPKQMAQLGRRMERLNMFLVRLELFVKSKPTTASASLYSGQLQDLGQLLESIQSNAERVYDLFDRYEKGILSRSKNLEFRAKWMSRIWFSLVNNSPEKVQAIMADIDYDRSVLSDYLALMAVSKLHEPVVTSQRRHKLSVRSLGDSEHSATVTRMRMPSPSPSPIPPRRDYSILFVDPYNTERSVVAEALVKLLGRMTLQAGGDWRIATVHSAGFFVKNMSDCADVVDGLDYSYPSFKKPLAAGGQAPEPTSMAAVFDNQWCDYPFKKDIRDKVAAGRLSRGLRKDMFSRYDFVIVFTFRDHDNMIKLKGALRREREATGSSAAAPRTKGRVLQLGTFLSQKRRVVREILYPPPRPDDDAKNRERWNGKVAEIKTAVKGFLKHEMKWTQPSLRESAADGGQKASKPAGA